MKWGKIKILDIEPHYYKKKYSEMLQNKSTNNTLNIQLDTGSLISKIYNSVISSEKTTLETINRNLKNRKSRNYE